MEKEQEIELLLQIAEEKLENPGKKHNKVFNEATRFVMALDISQGSTKIPAIALWDSYKKWKQDIQEPVKIKENEFFKQFNKIYKRRIIAGYSFYMLDPKDFDLSDDNLAKIRKEKLYVKNYKKGKRKSIKKAQEIHEELQESKENTEEEQN